MSPDTNITSVPPPTSTKRPPPDDNEQPSKKSRTGDLVADKDPSESVDKLDYSQGVLSCSSLPNFPRLRETLGPYLVDKTKLIENILKNKSFDGRVDLVLRPRRCGKSTMLQMLKSFFGIAEEVGAHQLFRGLYIADQHELCGQHMGRYPVIFLDFKNLAGQTWEEMFKSFRQMVSNLFKKWFEYVWPCLIPSEQAWFESIRDNAAPDDSWVHPLTELCTFLHRRSMRRVIVLIDEYDAPLNFAYRHNFFSLYNEYFGRLVLARLLKSNEDLEYGLLVGITPTAKHGWYSALNNLDIHALHRRKSIFAGMLMFTEDEVLKLRTLSKCELDPGKLKDHYNSYLAGGHISVYNPFSIMSAFMQSEIRDFWTNSGQYPLIERNIPEDITTMQTIEALLAKKEVSFSLQKEVTFSIEILNTSEMLTLLYYAGYVTMTSVDTFKVPNGEVMMDWARWIVGGACFSEDILNECAYGPISAFTTRWPDFLQNSLDPKSFAKARGAKSNKTPERIYQVHLLGLFHTLRLKGWDVAIEPKAGTGYIDVRLISKKEQTAIIIEVKSSKTEGQIERDADKALQQIVDKNYRNREGLSGIRILREYGIASYHLMSFAKGRYLELNGQGKWVEKDDSAKAPASL